MEQTVGSCDRGCEKFVKSGENPFSFSPGICNGVKNCTLHLELRCNAIHTVPMPQFHQASRISYCNFKPVIERCIALQLMITLVSYLCTIHVLQYY